MKTLLILLMTCQTSWAGPAPGFHFGLSMANADISPNVNPQTRYGLVFGGLLEIPFDRYFFLQPEVSYIQKGVKQSFAGSTFTVRLDYIEFPVLLKAKLTDGTVRPFGFLGPNLGVRVDAALEASNTQIAQSFDISGVERLDFAFDLGGGLEYEGSGLATLFLSARYSLGITDVTTTGSVWNSRGIQILAGGIFPLE